MIIITWIIFCIVIGQIARKMGRDWGRWTLLSVFISPLGGLILLLVMGRKNKETDETVVDTAPVVETTIVKPEEPKQIASVEKRSTFCPSCGNKVDAGTAFCPQCGTKLTE